MTDTLWAQFASCGMLAQRSLRHMQSAATGAQSEGLVQLLVQSCCQRGKDRAGPERLGVGYGSEQQQQQHSPILISLPVPDRTHSIQPNSSVPAKELD